jgi:15-cis-phytoene synthase
MPWHMALDASYQHCRQMARGSSFYPAFFLVAPERRRALWAVYAFNRRCDDLSDSGNASLAALRNWREQLDAALSGHPAADPIWPAFADSAARYHIPRRCFDDMITGVSSDLTESTKATYADLYRYCFQVASVVGISVSSIFGAQSPEAQHLAEQCGVAVQLTNIIRDVKEDLALGRVYLPQEDLRQAGITAIADSPAMRQLLRHQGARARQLYRAKQALLTLVDPKTRPCLNAIIGVYETLLDKLEAQDFAVFDNRIRLSTPGKLAVLARSWLTA